MPKRIKLFIHHRYGDVESGPAAVVGAHRGKKLARLEFIPFMFATPTYGDVVAAARDPEFEGQWAYEVLGAHGMDPKKLHEHGGRYAMIVDFVPGGTHSGPWFPGRADIMSSLALHADAHRPGRIYFAVPGKMKPADVMEALAKGHPEYQFTQIHPTPRKQRPVKKKATKKKPAAKQRRARR